MVSRCINPFTRLGAALPLLLVALAACEPMRVGPGIASLLGHGRQYADSVQRVARTVQRPEQIGPATALSAGYLERLRLGLGSPFRLIDFALHDPRLPEAVRTRLAWALLARTVDGVSYHIDPRTVEGLVATGAPAPDLAPMHLALIEKRVSRAGDPRSAELAVRLAYALADARGAVSPRAVSVAARTAVLVGDRVLSRRDAMRLLRTARDTDEPPLQLLERWRSERRFAVEAPSMQPLPAAAERQALDAAPELAVLVEGLAADSHPASADDDPASQSVLGPAAALRLSALAAQLNAPPVAPVAVSVQVHREALLVGADDSMRAPRWRFIARAHNEETLVAELAILGQQSAAGDAAMQTVASAALWLRASAQEPVWFPGDPAPTFTELADNFGLAALTFDPVVPERWRPYYRRMLSLSLTDLQRVVPDLDVEGLRVHVGGALYGGAALALHDPRHRVLYLPYTTGAGTLAHEIAHDLDWQAARSRFAVRGDYATDRAAREQRSAFARSVRGLVATSVAPPRDGAHVRVQSQRPAEVFARSMDWLVAAALAREGRSDGYLSAVQDPVLTGYVSVSPPDASGEPGRSLIEVLDGVAPLPTSLRAWFLARYGPAGASGFDLVRRIVDVRLAGDAPLDDDEAADDLLPLARVRDEALGILGTERCADAGGALTALLDARERAVRAAVDARLDGLSHVRSMLVSRDHLADELALASVSRAPSSGRGSDVNGWADVLAPWMPPTGAARRAMQPIPALCPVIASRNTEQSDAAGP